MVAFRSYESKTAGVRQWLSEQEPEIRAEMLTELEFLQAQADFADVTTVKRLRGKCLGLTEIKVDFERDKKEVHVRILGCDGPGRGEFTLLLPFLKKGGPDYGPACRSAFNRKRRVEKDGRLAQSYRFP